MRQVLGRELRREGIIICCLLGLGKLDIIEGESLCRSILGGLKSFIIWAKRQNLNKMSSESRTTMTATPTNTPSGSKSQTQTFQASTEKLSAASSPQNTSQSSSFSTSTAKALAETASQEPSISRTQSQKPKLGSRKKTTKRPLKRQDLWKTRWSGFQQPGSTQARGFWTTPQHPQGRRQRRRRNRG